MLKTSTNIYTHSQNDPRLPAILTNCRSFKNVPPNDQSVKTATTGSLHQSPYVAVAPTLHAQARPIVVLHELFRKRTTGDP